jgi:hypothetical protein
LNSKFQLDLIIKIEFFSFEDGKETYQSELEEITVPVEDINQKTEGIKVVGVPGKPDNLQG